MPCICTYEGLCICIPCIKIAQDPCLTCTVARAPSVISLFRRTCQYSFHIICDLS